MIGLPARTFVSTPAAAFIAGGLFLVMGAWIAVDEGPPEERDEVVDFQVTSEKTDTDVLTRDNRPEEPEDVRTPPPPPRIETQKAEKPAEGLASILGRLPEIDPQDVGGDSFEFTVADRNEQPIFRPTQYPRRAAERGTEGTCTVTVDVLPDGSVVNPRANCSSSVFVSQVKRDATKWRYQPRVEEGQQVVRYNLTVRVDYNLED